MADAVAMTPVRLSCQSLGGQRQLNHVLCVGDGRMHVSIRFNSRFVCFWLFDHRYAAQLDLILNFVGLR